MTTVKKTFVHTFDLDKFLDASDTFLSQYDQDIINWAKEFKYQTFDPVEVFKNIKAKGWTVDAITCALVFYVTRGSKITALKVQNKSTSNAKEIINILRTQFGLTETSNTLPPSAISLPRLAVVFAPLTCAIMHRYGTPIVSVDSVPKAFSWPGSVCMLSSKDTLRFNQLKAWNIAFSKIVKGDESKIEPIMNASVQNKFHSETRRDAVTTTYWSTL